MEFQPLLDQVAGKPEQGHEQLMADKTRNVASSLRAGGNRGNVRERVRRKSHRFLPENTAMIPRVGHDVAGYEHCAAKRRQQYNDLRSRRISGQTYS